MSEGAPMKYRFLGSSGVYVSAVGLGTMNFNKSNVEESIAILEEFVKRGGNFVDTADVYSAGESEEVVGKWLSQTDVPRADIFLATKVHFQRINPRINGGGLSKVHILDSVAHQLERLQTPYIDLLQIHNWDESTPVKEWLTTLNGLISDGKIRFYGVCNVTGWQLQKIISTAEALGFRPPVAVQNQYNLLSREVEHEVLHCAAVNGVAFLPWSPLKGGWLTGKFRKDVEPDPTTRVGKVSAGKARKLQSSPDYAMFANDKTWGLLDAMDAVAAAHGVSVAQVATRWLLQRPAVQSVLIGPRTMDQMLDCLNAAQWAMTADEMKSVTEASAVPIPYPYEMVWRACRPPAGRLDGNLWPLPTPALANLPGSASL